MADRIDDLISPKVFDQFKALGIALVDIEDRITALNKLSITVATDTKGAGNLADLNLQQQRAATAAKALAEAYEEMGEAERKAIALKARHNGSSKEVIRLMIEEERRERAAIQTSQEKQKAEQGEIDTKIKQERLKREGLRTSALIEAANRRAAKAVAEETSAYRQLSKAYNEAALKAKDMAINLGDNHPATLQATKDASEMGARLKELDKRVGDHRREVGNYALATQGLGRTFGQLAGELPSLSNGFRTFASAIGNNLAPFFEEMKRVAQSVKDAKAAGAANADAQGEQAKATALAGGASEEAASQIAELAKQQALAAVEGQRGATVFSALRGALFSFTTLLNVGITLFTIFGPKIYDALTGASKATKDAEEANKKYAESLKQMDESARSSAQQDIARLKVLIQVAANEEETMKVRLQAVKELQDTYPGRFANLSKEAILEGRVANAVKETTKELLKRAEFQAAEKKFAAAREKEYDERLSRDDALAKAAAVKKVEEDLADARNRQYSKDKKEREDAYADVRRLMATRTRFLKEYGVGTLFELDKLAVEAEQRRLAADNESQRFLSDSQKSAAQAGDTIFGNGGGKGPKDKAAKDLTNERLKSEQDFTRGLYAELRIRTEIEAEKQQAIYENDANTLEQRLAAYDEYSRRRIEAAGFTMAGEKEATIKALREISKIEGISEDKRTNEQKDLLLEKDTLEQRKVNLTKKFELEQTKIINDQAKYRRDLQEKYADEAEKATTEALRYLNSIRNGGPSETRADHDKAEQALNDQYISAIKNVAGVAHNLSERKLNDIDKELEAIEKRKNAEINSIEKSTLSEEEKQKRIALAEAKATQQSESLAAKRRKIAERQYQVDKAINIASIIQETSLAVIRALNDKTVPYPVRIGYAIGAGITGAAQLALALSAPPPQFFKGTESSPEGPAWVGERGTEMYVTPDGKIGLTPDSATLTYLQGGTQIIDHKKTVDILDYVGLGLSGLRTPENTGNKELSEGMDKMADKIVSAIKSKKDVTLTGHPDWWKDYSYKRGKS